MKTNLSLEKKALPKKHRGTLRRDKKGVSPVIGVILMVAATIVIAAVVLAMLGGFTAPTRSYSVSVKASKTPAGNVSVTYMGGPDASYVSSTSVVVTNITTPANTEELTLSAIVGNTSSTSTYAYGMSEAHVIATTLFTDGSSQVVLDTYV
jgi:flagellin-like protein